MESYHIGSNEKDSKIPKTNADSNASSVCILNVLPDELIVRMTSKMDITTLEAFRLVCKKAQRLSPTRKQFESLTLERATRRLLKKLARLPNGLGKIILDLLQKEKAIIAGGYVLQCITGDSYSDSDIDIFINARSTLCKTVEEMLAREHLFGEEGLSVIENAFEVKSPTSPFYRQPIAILNRYQKLSQLENVFEIQTADVKVQFLFACSPHNLGANRSVKDYVEDQFDLDVCKGWFDGYTVGSLHLLAQLKKVATLCDPIMKWNKRLQTKYEKRYQTSMRDDTNVMRVLKKRSAIVDARIEKYQKRGFKIIVTH